MYLEPGQEINTKIISISKDCAFLDLNAKSEGILPIADIQNEDGSLRSNVGDSIKVYFIGVKDGEMIFTTRISGENADTELLEHAYRHGTPVEGHIGKEIKGGFEVSIGNARGFCPFSQMGFREKKGSADYVGRTLTFKIQEFKEDGKNLLLSNRAILEEEHTLKLKKLEKELKVGTRVNATVESIQQYGAFVDIGNFKVLLPVSEISRERISDVGKVLKVGQEFEVVIIKTDWEHERVSVSRKALLKDPWDDADAKYPEGTKLTGKISRITNFGIFVELESGIDGLVHISELDNADRGTNLQKLYKIGDPMPVTVKSTDQKEKRISLKPSSTKEEDLEASKYMSSQDNSETYNPFAILLRKR